MVRVINDEFFNLVTKEMEGKYGKYYTTSCQSAFEVTDRNNEEKTYPRTLAIISHAEEDNINETNSKLTVNTTDKGANSIWIRQSSNYQFDSDIWLIAIPFNGTLVPMEKSYDYRIYKAFIIGVKGKDVKLDGKNYDKIAYLAISLNTRLFDPENEHAKDKLKLKVTSAITDHESNVLSTTSTIMTFDKDNLYTYEEKEDEVDLDTVSSILSMSKSKKKLPTFPIFTPRANKLDSDDRENNKDTKTKYEKTPESRPNNRRQVITNPNPWPKKKPSKISKDNDSDVVYSSGDGEPLNNSLEEMIAKAQRDAKDKTYVKKDNYKKKKKHH